jgi:hypothetical protein
MNKNVLLIGAIISALATFSANASDDKEHEDNPVTVPVVTTPNPTTVTVTNNSTNTVDNVVSNVLDNHNTAYTNNTNTLRQDQAQTQVQDQQQQQEATSYSTSQGGSAVAHGGAATARSGARLEPRLAALPFGLFSGPATTSTRAMLVLSDMPRASCKVGHRVQLSPYKRDLLSTAPRPSARPREHKSVPQPEPTPSSSSLFGTS